MHFIVKINGQLSPYVSSETHNFILYCLVLKFILQNLLKQELFWKNVLLFSSWHWCSKYFNSMFNEIITWQKYHTITTFFQGTRSTNSYIKQLGSWHFYCFYNEICLQPVVLGCRRMKQLTFNLLNTLYATLITYIIKSYISLFKYYTSLVREFVHLPRRSCMYSEVKIFKIDNKNVVRANTLSSDISRILREVKA